MDPLVFVLVLAAAVLHATWNALVKAGADSLLVVVLFNLTGAAIALPFALALGPPAAEAWPYLIATTLLHAVYFGLLAAAYLVGDLSHVYPISRGSAPLIIVALSYAIAGEELGIPGIAAVTLISLAILGLALGGRGLGRDGWKPVSYAVVIGLFVSAYTVVDGLGGRAAGGVERYIAWLFLLAGIPLPAFAALIRGRTLLAGLRAAWRPGVTSGVLGALGYAIVIWAMSLTPIAYVSALRESSVVIAAFIGSRMLGEPFGRQRIVAAVAVVAGVALLQFGGGT